MSRLDDAVAEYMALRKHANVIRMHPVSTRRYEQANGYSPAGRSEVWCVMDRRRPGGMTWFRCSFEALEKYLRTRRGDWYLVPVSQNVDYPDTIKTL